MAKFNTPQGILEGRRYYIVAGFDWNNIRVVTVHNELPTVPLEVHDAVVYEVITNLSLEDFRLGGGFFSKPRDWLSFAKRTGAEQVEPKDRGEQLEFFICLNCNTMQEPGNDFCVECHKATGEKRNG